MRVIDAQATTASRALRVVCGPSGGVADSLDEAKAAFRAVWEAGG